MTYLLDTHTFLWYIRDDQALTAKARALIADVQNTVFLSIASVWEISIKVSLGKLTLPDPYDQFIYEQVRTNRFTLYPISVEHTAVVAGLPYHHRDPFDRLIIAQALADDLAIIGNDVIFDRYGITRYW